MSPRKPKAMDGYVRVSRVGGREGESFISPSVQRDAIERLAASKGIELAEIVEELDVSGGKKIDDRELGRLVRKVEAGDSDGVIVWKVSRFSRNLLDGVTAATRVTEAGGRLIGEDLDTGQPMGKALLGFLMGWAEEERDQRRQSWEVAVRRATKRGVHVGPTPTGYRRTTVDPNTGKPRGPLVVDKVAAPHIRMAFEMRADGASLQEIADYLAERGVFPNARKRNGDTEATQAGRWSRAGVKAMLSSRVYLGIAFHGTDELHNAHPAVVDDATYEAAQIIGAKPKHDGSVAAHGLLLGVARCAGCGEKLHVNASGPQGKRMTSYYCRDPKTRACEAPAAARTERVDELVEPEILKRLRKRASRQTADKRAELAGRRAAEAERELDAFIEGTSIAVLGQDRYNARATRLREEMLEAQRLHLEALKDAAEVEETSPHEWDALPMAARRRVAAGLIDSVTIRKADPKRGRWDPVEGRVAVAWR